ncbi:UDP-N-acetylmuramate--L-alanine ligase [Schleiferia thermophila]|jgi:UDP-N-acetylmuramate: L-alanyl-gamma-D-glutamyl-meso-diaminopimelate ligase|uniref:UDP-N-acetylmuramate--L-alanine ligase n=1 Tax=Schleiferia thermophila TaxID=884107 RepID=UPI0004E6C438|nr:Mur ligase domain-containing protein [Schleiferia thermophila]KFD39137.1 peptidoglycan synthetase [Schleiferia thermophila str. Yellowstone]
MKIHLIAIGGSAMHNLALALHAMGHKVTGSDDEIYEPALSRLKKAGLLPERIGWFPEKITSDLDMVILGMHARRDNPELQKALNLGLQVISYPEFLYQHSKNKTRVVIAGSHGKTTVTSMVMHVCRFAGLNIDYMVGSLVNGFDTMVNLTEEAEFMVIEGDEYPSSALQMQPKFHFYRPNITAITGIAWDHANVFPTEDIYLEQFRTYLNQCEPGAAVLYFAEDQKLKHLVESSSLPIKKFPYATPAYEIINGIYQLNTSDGPIPLCIIGRHNMANVEAARWICQLMGIQEGTFYESISTFEGASRRLQTLLEIDESRVILDFAHAPSKVKATLYAIKEAFPQHKVVAILELHTYSSLSKDFLPQYHHSLQLADVALVYYNPRAVALKKLPDLQPDEVAQAFGIDVKNVFTDTGALFQKAVSYRSDKNVFLIMTSGNFGGENLQIRAEQLLHS